MGALCSSNQDDCTGGKALPAIENTTTTTGNFTAAEAKKIFVLFDTDSSGILEPAEIVGFIKLMKGVDKVDPLKIVETWDADKDGKVRRGCYGCCCCCLS